jgi:DNA-directed RNA polymerase subunit RPC12/RpoP
MAAERKERKDIKTKVVCQLCKKEVEPLKSPYKCPHCGGSLFSVKLGKRETLWSPGSVYEHREQRALRPLRREPQQPKGKVDESFWQWLRRNLRWLWARIKRILSG